MEIEEKKITFIWWYQLRNWAYICELIDGGKCFYLHLGDLFIVPEHLVLLPVLLLLLQLLLRLLNPGDVPEEKGKVER